VTVSGALDALPALVAQDARAVLAGVRSGTGVQLHGSYFGSRERALATL
jgi:hypothetical protein